MRTIPLAYGRGTMVDDDDFERLSKYPWCFSHTGTGYVHRYTYEGGKQKAILMHREIMNPAEDMEIDHIDHDGLNNCKSNLREVTRAQNSRNKRCPVGGTSIYKGVRFRKGMQKFGAQIKFNYKAVHLGYFTDERQAALAYNEAAVKYYGVYACLNVL